MISRPSFRLASLLTLAILLVPLGPEEVSGALWAPYDLRSLAAVSRSIVLAREEKTVSLGRGVYGFSQMGNPGPICPYRLSLPPEATQEGFVPVEGRPVTLDVYEKQILEAILVVESARVALAKAGDPRGRELLLQIIEKAYSRDAAWGGDVLLPEVVKRLLAAGDLEGVLEVMARTEFHEFRLENQTLLEAAERRLPGRLRVAAIRALDIWHTRDTEALARVAGLASDRVPEVRRAALDRLRFAHRGYVMNEPHQTRGMTAPPAARPARGRRSRRAGAPLLAGCRRSLERPAPLLSGLRGARGRRRVPDRDQVPAGRHRVPQAGAGGPSRPGTGPGAEGPRGPG